MEPNEPAKPDEENPPPARELASQERWLVKVFKLAHDTKSAGVLTADAILEAFTPSIIMCGSSTTYPGFNQAPHRRADVLGETVGTKRKTALKQSAMAAAEALSTAIEVGDTTKLHVLNTITIEDLVRYQDPAKIWQLLEKTSWWTKQTASMMRDFMASCLTSLVEESLLGTGEETYTAIVNSVSTDLLTSNKAPEKLRKQLLDMVRELPEKVRDSHIMSIFTPAELVKFVPLATLHKVLEAVAQKYSWIASVEMQAEEPEVDAVGELEQTIGYRKLQEVSGAHQLPEDPAKSVERLKAESERQVEDAFAPFEPPAEPTSDDNGEEAEMSVEAPAEPPKSDGMVDPLISRSRTTGQHPVIKGQTGAHRPITGK